ncbi:MAG: peptidase, partial [Crocosphaera sp.]
LDHNFVNPVIFASPLSLNGAGPAITRITDIQSNSFSVQVQEPSNEDGIHGLETFSYLAFDKGIWELSDGTIIEVGTIDTNAIAGPNWENIIFSHDFANAPIVLTQVQTDNDASFVKTRQNNITQNGFKLALEQDEFNRLNNTAHGTETVAWVAISPGQGNWDGNAFMAGNTGDNVTHDWQTINFGNVFNNAPKFLGNISSFNGSDPSGLRYQNLNNGNVQIKVDEDTSFDTEIGHTTESVNYLAIEGTGTLQGKSADALTGLITQQSGTASQDTFVVGNAQQSLYDVYGQADYLEISDFNDSHQDLIQLKGIADNYSLAASPSGSSDQGIFLKVAGMEDELVAIVKNRNDLNLNSSQFAFV